MLVTAEIIISVILIALVLLQERSAGASGVFGGGGGSGTPYQTRRGLEKGTYWATIVVTVLLVALAVANLIL